eukprot:6841967-Prorocentrum_lima.AAC.1
MDELTNVTKQLESAQRRDKHQHQRLMVTEEMDIRDRWSGLKALKTAYSPVPCRRTTSGARGG